MAELRWHRAASLADVRDGEILGVRIGGACVALVRLDGEIHAIDDLCTHDFAFLSQGFLDCGEIECPLHAARFDVATGKCLEGPAMTDLRVYPVRIVNDDIEVGIDPDSDVVKLPSSPLTSER
jgi:nitrite reductase/ring-hydroxylating ferredoxin subunit